MKHNLPLATKRNNDTQAKLTKNHFVTGFEIIVNLFSVPTRYLIYRCIAWQTFQYIRRQPCCIRRYKKLKVILGQIKPPTLAKKEMWTFSKTKFKRWKLSLTHPVQSETIFSFPPKWNITYFSPTHPPKYNISSFNWRSYYWVFMLLGCTVTQDWLYYCAVVWVKRAHVVLMFYLHTYLVMSEWKSAIRASYTPAGTPLQYLLLLTPAPPNPPTPATTPSQSSRWITG